jgi:predicted peroxiredoxin
VGKWGKAPEGARSRPSRILVDVPGLLIVTSAGPEDPTRASIPFHIAVNGAKPNGTEVAIALAGDAAELVKPDVIANVLGLGLPPLRDLLDKCLDQDVPFYV